MAEDKSLEAGLRFVHQMEVETRVMESRLSIEVGALTDLLIAKGLISARELDERKELARMEQTKRDARRTLPMLNPTADKYVLQPPEIPCAENLSLCKGACCRLVFDLSMQDLDEGVVKWEYGRPYRIKQHDGRCVHLDDKCGCTVYEHRPAVCRTYDCRQDKRIWVDYDKRIPNPELDKLNAP